MALPFPFAGMCKETDGIRDFKMRNRETSFYGFAFLKNPQD